MSTPALAHTRRRLALSACAGALALGLAACGGGGDKDPDPAQAVPASVPVYAQVTVRPDGDLRQNVENVSKRLFGSSDVAALIDKELKSSGDNSSLAGRSSDWVGSRAGIFVSGVSSSSADVAVVLGISDKGKAQESLDASAKGETKKSYKDVDYYVDKNDTTTVSGIVGDYAVVGTERGLKIVVDTVKGDSVAKIADSKKYTDALGAVGDSPDTLATAYADPQGLISALARSGGVPSSALASARQAVAQAGSGWAAKFNVSNNALTIDFAATGVKQRSGAAASVGAATKALEGLPGTAWLGIGTGTLGEQLRSAIQQGLQAATMAGQDVQSQLDAIQQQLGINIDDDLLSWMGDAGIFAQGTSITSIGGALVVQTTNPAKTKTAITKITKLLGQVAPDLKVSAARGVQGADSGIQIADPNLPFPILAVVGGDRFVVGIGKPAVEAGLSPSTTLADSAGYKQAANALQGVDPTFYLDFPPVVTLLRALGLDSDPTAAGTLTALSKLGSVSAGTKTSGTTVHTKIVLTLPE